MAEERKAPKRIVVAPSTVAPAGPGDVLSVEVDPDEDVEWLWTHDRERGSTVTGYNIVSRETVPIDHARLATTKQKTRRSRGTATP